MSDDLVNRLRKMGDRASHRPSIYHTAADRLEALTARAEAAEAELKVMTAERDRAIEDAIYNAQYVDLVVHYRAERDAMAADNNRLREALKPFADEAEHWESWADDNPLVEGFRKDDGSYYDGNITVGDLRNARAALKGGQK